MKRRRGIFIGIALLAALASVVAALLCSSGIQTWMVRRMLSDQPALTASLERVHLGWSTVRIDGLELRQGPVTVRAPRIEATLSTWRLLGDDLRIQRLVAHDWELQYDPSVAPSSAVAPALPEPASAGWLPSLEALAGVLAAADGAAATRGLGGLLESLHLPIDVALDQLDLRGTAAWRHAGPGADGHATVAIGGGGLRSGETGNFTVTIDATADRASAVAIRSLFIESRLALTLADPRTLDHVSLTASLAARREDHAQVERFNLQLDLQVDEDSPRAEFSLRDEHVRLINLELRREETGEGLVGNWSTAINDISLGSLMLGRNLPSFTLEGQGSLSASKDLASGSIDGELSFAGSDFAVLRPELKSMGPLTGRLSFGAEMRDTGLRCTVLDLGLNGAAPVLAARLLQGIEVAHESNEIRVARPQEPVFSVQLLGVPPAWAQPWLEPLVLDARPIEGGFVGLISPHGLRVVTSEELNVRGLVAAREGLTLIDEIDVSLLAGAEITEDGWQVELDRLDLSDRAGPLATLSARGGRLTRENDVIKLAGRFESDVRVFNRVPLLARHLALASGRVGGEFGVGVEDRISLAVTLAASGLTLADGQAMPEMQFDGRIDLRENGAIEAHLPVRVTHGDRTSDLTLNVSATPANGGWNAEGSLSGPRAYVSDLQGLAVILAPEPPTMDGTPAVTIPGLVPAAASLPVWAGWTGSFKTAIGELTLPNALVLENVRGDLVLDAARLNLSGLSASLNGGGRVQIDGSLGFEAARERTYAAQGRVVAENVDIGAVLRTIDPSSLPALEGQFNVTMDLDSAVNRLDDLAAEAALSARVTSAGGVLRALEGDIKQYIEAGRTLAAVGGLVAVLRGTSGSSRTAARLDDATKVVDDLSTLAFDQLNLELIRSPGGNYVLRDIAVISPGVRLLGNGAIQYDESASIWTSPLALTLQLSVREEMAERLGRLGLLEPEADALGYRPLVETFQIDGTLVNFGTRSLWTLLERALR